MSRCLRRTAIVALCCWACTFGIATAAEVVPLPGTRPLIAEGDVASQLVDGVAPDEAVAAEFAKVRHLYQAKLGLGDRCQLEWFVGPHTINGKGTFEFLHEHLNWPSVK